MTWIPVFGLVLATSFFSAALGATPEGDSLDGVWVPVTAEIGGNPFPDEVRASIRLEIKGTDYIVTVGDKPDRGTCKLNPTAKPRAIDITGTEGPNKGRTILAIYERTGDRLRVCYDLTGKSRPTEFKTAPGTQLFLVEYQLKK
ncbi:MAG: TIGR03067 domain-containing protein [Isosphaeraceae bacterium]